MPRASEGLWALGSRVIGIGPQFGRDVRTRGTKNRGAVHDWLCRGFRAFSPGSLPITSRSSKVLVLVVGSSNSNEQQPWESYSTGSAGSNDGQVWSPTAQVVLCDDVKGVVDWGQCRKDGACYFRTALGLRFGALHPKSLPHEAVPALSECASRNPCLCRVRVRELKPGMRWIDLVYTDEESKLPGHDETMVELQVVVSQYLYTILRWKENQLKASEECPFLGSC